MIINNTDHDLEDYIYGDGAKRVKCRKCKVIFVYSSNNRYAVSTLTLNPRTIYPNGGLDRINWNYIDNLERMSCNEIILMSVL